MRIYCKHRSKTYPIIIEMDTFEEAEAITEAINLQFYEDEDCKACSSIAKEYKIPALKRLKQKLFDLIRE